MRQRRATYTVEEASSLLGISTSKLYRCIRAGELRGLHVGRRVASPAPVKVFGGLLDLTGDEDGTALWLAVEETADFRLALLTEDTDGAVSIAAGVLADQLLAQIAPETIRQVWALEEVAC